MKNIWNKVESVSRGGSLEAAIYNNGGDSWKVEISFSDDGRIFRRRYFNFHRDFPGIYNKAHSWALENITLTPVTFS